MGGKEISIDSGGRPAATAPQHVAAARHSAANAGIAALTVELNILPVWK